MRPRCFLAIATILLAGLPAVRADAQAVKGMVPADAPPPALMYHGLIPGLSTLADVKAALGEPVYAGRWYNYKMYYPAADRPGLIDVVHMRGENADAALADIEAASVPAGFETERTIRAALGEPEYALHMPSWSLLDYGERGVRFALDANGETIGVTYVPHLYRRVPQGERSVVDLRGLRDGKQPTPERPATAGGMNLEVGAAEVDITPTGKDWLGHRYKVVTRLKSRIAVFRRGELTVAFVGADLFGLSYADNLAIREGARALGVDATIIGSAHNHASGDTIGVYGHYPTEYIRHIHDRTLAGIQKALENMEPVVELRGASKELPMDGTRVQGLFRNARNPGVLDPTLSTVQAIGANGEPVVTLVNFACHVESIERGDREVTADFPGYMCDQMKADGLGQPVFLNGALGGMVSGDNDARTYESSKKMGLELARLVKDLVTIGVPPAEAAFAFTAEVRPLRIPVTNRGFVARYKSGMRELARGSILTDMTYVRLGEAQFMSLPGELLPELSFEVLEKMDGYPRMLVGLGNDQIGYMIPPYDFRDDYYEETMSQGPATGTQVRDMARRILDDERERRGAEARD